MKNVSINGEPVILSPGSKYIIIDALYASCVKEEFEKIDKEIIFDEIRNKVFPYTDTPFVVYEPVEGIFRLEKIMKIAYDQNEFNSNFIFSTDCGVLLFIKESIFIDFVNQFDFGELVDSSIELLNQEYLDAILKNRNQTDLAIIVAPGFDLGVEFDGSGSYVISDSAIRKA